MENVKIDNENKMATLALNSSLYSYDAIIKASKEFTGNFWVMIESYKNDKVIIHLKPKAEFENDIDLNELAQEFYNYTLGMMQQLQ